MQVVVVFESLFGNTHAVAEAVAEGARAGGGERDTEVRLLRVSEASPAQLREADVLVVGGPTHIRRMTSARSRRLGLQGQEKAAEERGLHLDAEPDAQGPGVRDWFERLPLGRPHTLGAAFDTRAASRFAGGASHGIDRQLRRHGYELIGEPEGFVVEGTEGPLRAGERDRARAWGAALVRQAASLVGASG